MIQFMNERLLQYIWQFRLFNHQCLKDVNGDDVFIIHPGIYNTDQGPDFQYAKIRLNNTIIAGSIELHMRASDWLKHGHSFSALYSNVILHVVWENDMELGFPFPTLELRGRVAGILLDRYEKWMKSKSFIPCSGQLQDIPSISVIAWKEKMVVERLQQRTELILQYCQQTKDHWEEIFWWVLARNFGMSVNGFVFENIARSVSVIILAKYKNNLQQIEALLLGQAKMLEKEFNEAYPVLLQREFRFLRLKHKLAPIREHIRFLRMRPSNFPTIRLAQLAMLIHKSAHLFSYIKETSELSEIKEKLSVTADKYWDDHYMPGELSVTIPKKIGEQMVENILINTVVPMLFAYGYHTKQDKLKEKALGWLEYVNAEKNRVIKEFGKMGLTCCHASDTQAVLYCYKEYCTRHRCLDCLIGNRLLKQPEAL